MGKRGAKAPPIISPIGALGTGSGLHSLGVNAVRAIQSQCGRKSRPPIKGGMPLRNERDEGEKTGGESEKQSHVLGVYKNSPTHVHLVA